MLFGWVCSRGSVLICSGVVAQGDQGKGVGTNADVFTGSRKGPEQTNHREAPDFLYRKNFRQS
jgi:hypothetical protein